MKIIWLVIVSITFIPNTAHAAPAWELREVRGRDQRVEYCITEQMNAQGARLSVAQTADGRMNLGLALPRHEWPLKTPIKLGLQFSQPVKEFVLAAAAAMSALLLADMNPDLLALWQRAKMVRLTALDKSVVFSLADSTAALQALAKCAGSQPLLREKETSLPKLSAPRDNLMPDLATITTPIMAVLQQAGVAANITPITTPNNMSFVSEAWRYQPESGGLINGGAQAFLPQPDFRTAVRGQLAILKGFCRGLWSEERDLIMVKGATQQQTVRVNCASAASTEVMGVVFHSDNPQTAHYITHTGSGDEAEAVMNITQTIAAAWQQMVAAAMVTNAPALVPPLLPTRKSLP